MLYMARVTGEVWRDCCYHHCRVWTRSIQMRVHTKHEITRRLWINQSVPLNAVTSRRKGVGVDIQGRTKNEV